MQGPGGTTCKPGTPSRPAALNRCRGTRSPASLAQAPALFHRADLADRSPDRPPSPPPAHTRPPLPPRDLPACAALGCLARAPASAASRSNCLTELHTQPQPVDSPAKAASPSAHSSSHPPGWVPFCYHRSPFCIRIHVFYRILPVFYPYSTHFPKLTVFYRIHQERTRIHKNTQEYEHVEEGERHILRK